MDHSESHSADPAAVTGEQQVTTAVQRLIDAGWVRNGGPTVTVSRHWPDEVAIDTVLVVTRELTRAQRDVPGRDMVRQAYGTLDDVVEAVLGWPPPGGPDELVSLPSHRKDFT